MEEKNAYVKVYASLEKSEYALLEKYCKEQYVSMGAFFSAALQGQLSVIKALMNMETANALDLKEEFSTTLKTIGMSQEMVASYLNQAPSSVSAALSSRSPTTKLAKTVKAAEYDVGAVVLDALDAFSQKMATIFFQERKNGALLPPEMRESVLTPAKMVFASLMYKFFHLPNGKSKHPLESSVTAHSADYLAAFAVFDYYETKHPRYFKGIAQAMKKRDFAAFAALFGPLKSYTRHFTQEEAPSLDRYFDQLEASDYRGVVDQLEDGGSSQE